MQLHPENLTSSAGRVRRSTSQFLLLYLKTSLTTSPLFSMQPSAVQISLELEMDVSSSTTNAESFRVSFQPQYCLPAASFLRPFDWCPWSKTTPLTQISTRTELPDRQPHLSDLAFQNQFEISLQPMPVPMHLAPDDEIGRSYQSD